MIIPLTSLRPGEVGIVVNLQGGPNFRSKLYAMGLAPGATVRVVNVYNPGPVVVEVGGARLALGRGIASRVLVRKL
ncbi:FeoA family protein [Thermococcus gorgonarius]|uniref:Fe2+ transport protein n=1 Tax=Thermococcus gorgonarius TaxID=71997 RepID=A0A2Z2M9C3_THEGO|nr:ferrous iron transport protein A [Thermococcus gorgonarius]ASJ01052.1 Fe2+ transport protein [Thermococcus gorgonarius]